jgi:hypothetical protein
MYKHLLFHLNNFISVYRGVVRIPDSVKPGKDTYHIIFPVF